MDIPSSREEMNKLGINQLDVIIVTGDSFVDHPSFGAAIIARVLKEISGLSVGVISQPDWKSEKDITRLGKPKYFFGVTSGNIDSMVANYTASKRKRKTDDYSPDKLFRPRPDRATIVYSNLIKNYYKDVPIVLGGIEASLRRLAHYDWWQDKVKNSILLDSKADYIVYGMGEKTIIEIAEVFKSGKNHDEIKKLRGIVYKTSKPEEIKEKYIEIPSKEETEKDPLKYNEAFKYFYDNNDALNSEILVQRHQNRYVVQNLPQFPLSTEEMDRVYNLGYTRKVHPYEEQKGYVKSLDTVKFSVTSHRGCYGQCSFCALTVHQGRTVQYRSIPSVIKEIEEIKKDPSFNGFISDIGGPTANMYGYECEKKKKYGACKDKSCIGYEKCEALKPDHSNYMELLEKVSETEGVKKVFISSGIRLDLIYADDKNGKKFLRKIVEKHISGRMKIAPEHSEDEVLEIMNKPKFSLTEKWIEDYKKINSQQNKNQYFSAYLIAAHPGSTIQSEKNLKKRLEKSFDFVPEQVQIFTPTPSTRSTTIYYTGIDPITGKKVFTEKDEKKRKEHKEIIIKNKFKK